MNEAQRRYEVIWTIIDRAMIDIDAARAVAYNQCTHNQRSNEYLSVTDAQKVKTALDDSIIELSAAREAVILAQKNLMENG